MPMTHYGDPCIHCGIAHDDVPPGPCMGDCRKVRPIRYRAITARRADQRKHLLVQFSDGSFEDYYLHPDEPDPWSLQVPPRYDEALRRPQ